MDEATIKYPGVKSVTRWSFVVNKGIVPSVLLLETVPVSSLAAQPADFTVTVGKKSITFPDMVPAKQWVAQRNELRGFRNTLRLLDHRWRWKFGAISGIYNVRLPDGTVDPTTKKTPAQLATLCLQAMGERGFNVARMPTGMFPPINWDKTNPAEALDALCRYVGCEITGGELAKVEIWPLGQGTELPEGKYINPPFTLKAQDKPKVLVVQGGNTVFQSRLKLLAVARNDITSLPPTTLAPYAAQVNQSPFSFPDIANLQQRTDAFRSVYKWFYTNSQADGTHILPGCNTLISIGTQYRLLGILIDTFLNPDQIRLTNYPSVVGKFWHRGDDADECTSIITYNGHLAMDASRNLVQFPYPIWNLDTAGNIKAPELYLYTAYHVRGLDGTFEALKQSRVIGGSQGERILHRPEIFYSVKHSYNNANQIAATVTTIDSAAAEAKAYLDVFEKTYTDGDQRDVEWAALEKVSLDGRIQQIRYQGGPKEPFLMRASRRSECDLGPTAQEQRRDQFVDSLMEGRHVTA